MEAESILQYLTEIRTTLGLAGAVVGVVLLVLRQMLKMKVFPRMPKEGTLVLLMRIVNLLFILALVAVVLALAPSVVTALPGSNVADPDPEDEARRAVLDLKRDVLLVRGSWESMDDVGEPARRRVAQESAPLAQSLSTIDDGLLDLGERIQKYQYIAYANVMACDVSCESAQARRHCEAAIEAGKTALGLVDEATRDVAAGEWERELAKWTRSERSMDRNRFHLVLAHALLARLGFETGEESRMELSAVSDEYLEEVGYQRNPILIPILCVNGDDDCPSVASGPFPCGEA